MLKLSSLYLYTGPNVVYGFQSVSNHTIRNPHSARISIPSLFLPAPQGTPGPSFRWRTPLRSTSPYWESKFNPFIHLVDNCIDILKLCIIGWFKGLSSSFLSVRAARLLVLAGTDRLDKELMIGQMQGKFQLVVVPDTGHMIHEVWNLHSLKLYYHEPYTKYRIIPRDWPRS